VFQSVVQEFDGTDLRVQIFKIRKTDKRNKIKNEFTFKKTMIDENDKQYGKEVCFLTQS
jgi:hypothetical protein